MGWKGLLTMPNNAKWIIHNRILWGSSYTNLADIVRGLGYDAYEIRDVSLVDDLDKFNLPNESDCVIPYATIPVMRKLDKYFGCYLYEHELKYHVYTSNLGIDPNHFMNSAGLLIPYAQFKYKKDFWFKDTNRIFIRPDSGIKLFSGHVVESHNWDNEIMFLQSLNLSPETLMWVSPAQYFSDEVRFIICDGKVVDGSRYSTDEGNTLIEDKWISQDLWWLADIVAKAPWRPADVFTVDVAKTSKGPKIVELNSFSCAGWYACDAEKIVREVSEHTLKVWKELYE
jgi:hypothetical protein